MYNMSESQAFVALQTFLPDPTDTQFLTNLSACSRHSGVTCWPESILYLFRTYATPSEMLEALDNLQFILKCDEELEVAYRKLFNSDIIIAVTSTKRMRK